MTIGKRKNNVKNISDSFAAIDFETANEQFASVCSVGIVIVKEGIVVDRFYRLIRPEPDYYSYWNTHTHGITARDTDKAPVFPLIWKEAEKRINGLPLIAHNKAFDENCLKAVFRTYCMDYPGYDFHCTLQIARKLFKNLPNHKLNTVAAYCGYNLEHHHHALADAEACAMIALFVLNHPNCVVI